MADRKAVLAECIVNTLVAIGNKPVTDSKGRYTMVKIHGSTAKESVLSAKARLVNYREELATL